MAVALGQGRSEPAVNQWVRWGIRHIASFEMLFMLFLYSNYLKMFLPPLPVDETLFFGVLISAFYLYAGAMATRDMINGRASSSVLLAIDVAVAGMFVEVAARASWTVFAQNRMLHKSPER